MFKKEAEEYREKGKSEGYYVVSQEMEQEELDYIIDESFKDGAEFGYNKANEWHYVKDGDLPNTETKGYTYIRRRKRYERHFTDYRVIKCYVLCQNEKGKITAEVGYFDCNKKCFLDKAEGIVIAWKEIVLPKESE